LDVFLSLLKSQTAELLCPPSSVSLTSVLDGITLPPPAVPDITDVPDLEGFVPFTSVPWLVIPIPSVGRRQGVDFLNPTLDRLLAMVPTDPAQALEPFYKSISIWSVCVSFGHATYWQSRDGRRLGGWGREDGMGTPRFMLLRLISPHAGSTTSSTVCYAACSWLSWPHASPTPGVF